MNSTTAIEPSPAVAGQVVAICRIPTAKHLFLDTALKTVTYHTRLPRASRLRVNLSANLSANVPEGPMDSRLQRGIQ